MTKSTHKLTRQGVRDLGHSKHARPIELPPKQQLLSCPHLHVGVDRFGNDRCTDCGKILAIDDYGERL